MNQKISSLKKPLKSIMTDEQAVWLALPPRFLKDEGCYEIYEQGKSVDAWLTDPSDDKQKAMFLAKLSKRFKKEPTTEQLGDVALEAVKAILAR